MSNSQFIKLASLQASNEVWGANFNLEYKDWDPCTSSSDSGWNGKIVYGREVIVGYPPASNASFLGTSSSGTGKVYFPIVGFRIETNYLSYSEIDRNYYYRWGAILKQNLKIRIRIKNPNNTVLYNGEFDWLKGQGEAIKIRLIKVGDIVPETPSGNVNENNQERIEEKITKWAASTMVYNYAGARRREISVFRSNMPEGLYNVDIKILSETKITKDPEPATQSGSSTIPSTVLNDTTPTIYLGDYDTFTSGSNKSYDDDYCKCFYSYNRIYPMPDNIHGRGIVSLLSPLKIGDNMTTYIITMPSDALLI